MLLQENRYDICCFVRGSKKDVVTSNGCLYKLFEAVYVPMLLSKWVRPVVMVGFFAWICTSLAVIPHIDVGLNQEQSVPADSPVQKYFLVRKCHSFGFLSTADTFCSKLY